MNILSICCNQF